MIALIITPAMGDNLHCELVGFEVLFLAISIVLQMWLPNATLILIIYLKFAMLEPVVLRQLT